MLESYFDKSFIEAGCDEAGRGCLAGPVFAAAVILPKNFKCEELNDSKKLTEKKRYELRPLIEANALAYAVGIVDNEEIDKMNILRASIEAMHRAIKQLSIRPESLLIDGNRFYKFEDIPHHCIIKGDGKYLSIAAASILAKTYRDDYMVDLDCQHPEYGWKINKGYPTLQHRQAIVRYGQTSLHRLSFKCKDSQLDLFSAED